MKHLRTAARVLRKHARGSEPELALELLAAADFLEIEAAGEREPAPSSSRRREIVAELRAAERAVTAALEQMRDAITAAGIVALEPAPEPAPPAARPEAADAQT